MEEWKDIIGYEWHYKVSNLGKIKSIKYGKEKILKWSILKRFHTQICLSKPWKKNVHLVSRVVAIHFVPNPLNLPCACHREETLVNWALYNWADNLWWWTVKDNTQDCHKKWRANNHFTTNNPRPRLWKFWKDNKGSKPVNQYTLEWIFIKKWDSATDVQRKLWLLQTSICQCCKWKTNKVGWFVWKYS